MDCHAAPVWHRVTNVGRRLSKEDAIRAAASPTTNRNVARGAHVLVILDCRHSGPGTRVAESVGVRRAPTDLPYFTAMFDHKNGWIIDGGVAHGIESSVRDDTTLLALFPVKGGVEQLGALAFFGEPNDIAVSVSSSQSVPAGRIPSPRRYHEVACDHISYFNTEAGLGALADALG